MTGVGLFASDLNIGIYADVASLIVVLFPVFFILLTLYTPKEMGHAFRAAMEDTPFERAEAEKALVFFETAQKIFIVDALIGTVLGGIAMLRDLKDLTNIGLSVSILLCCILYSLLFIVLLTIPFRAALQKKIKTNK